MIHLVSLLLGFGLLLAFAEPDLILLTLDCMNWVCNISGNETLCIPITGALQGCAAFHKLRII